MDKAMEIFLEKENGHILARTDYLNRMIYDTIIRRNIIHGTKAQYLDAKQTFCGLKPTKTFESTFEYKNITCKKCIKILLKK